MRATLRRLLLLVTTVLVLAACSENESTGTAAEVASADPSSVSGVTPGAAADCSSPSPESPVPPTQAAGSSTAGTGFLQGHIYGVGGPAPGLHEAWSGTVTITGSGVRRDIAVGADGVYSVALPAGRYDIVGRSPHFGNCAYLCRARGNVDHKVLAGNTTTLNTYCSMS